MNQDSYTKMVEDGRDIIADTRKRLSSGALLMTLIVAFRSRPVKTKQLNSDRYSIFRTKTRKTALYKSGNL